MSLKYCMLGSVAVVLVVYACVLVDAAALDAPCISQGDKLVQESQFKAATEAYQHCSKQQGVDGMVAGWALYKAHDVFKGQLHDLSAALEACMAGWEVSHAAELAYCASQLSLGRNEYQQAMDWAQKAVEAGCFNGACVSVAQAHGVLQASQPNTEQSEILWEAPFNVLYQAKTKTGDALGAAQAYMKRHEALTTHNLRNTRPADYQAALKHVHIPTASRVDKPDTCGNQMIPLQDKTNFNRYQPVLHIVIMATSLDNARLRNLLRTAEVHKLRLTILSPNTAVGHAAGGKFGLRLQMVTNLLNMLHEEDYLMSLDAYDVALAGSEEDLVKGFHKAVAGRDVALFGAETGLWPDQSLGPRFPHQDHKYKYLNAGAFMGTVHALRCLMSAVQVNLTDSRYVFNDDQLLFSTLYVHTHNTSRPLIALDYGHDLFAPLWDTKQYPTMSFKPLDWEIVRGRGLTNKLTGGSPKIFHANGNQPLSFLDTELVPYILQEAADKEAARVVMAAGSIHEHVLHKLQFGRVNAEGSHSSALPLSWLAYPGFLTVVALALAARGYSLARRRRALHKGL